MNHLKSTILKRIREIEQMQQVSTTPEYSRLDGIRLELLSLISEDNKDNVMDLSEDQILADAKEKHKLDLFATDGSLFQRQEELKALIRYSRHIGFNEGYREGRNFDDEQMVEVLSYEELEEIVHGLHLKLQKFIQAQTKLLKGNYHAQAHR